MSWKLFYTLHHEDHITEAITTGSALIGIIDFYLKIYLNSYIPIVLDKSHVICLTIGSLDCYVSSSNWHTTAIGICEGESKSVSNFITRCIKFKVIRIVYCVCMRTNKGGGGGGSLMTDLNNEQLD